MLDVRYSIVIRI